MAGLCSLNQVKAALRVSPSGNTAADAALNQLLNTEIDAVRSGLEHLASRIFTKGSYSHELHSGGSWTVVVRNYPIDLTQTLQVWSFDGQNIALLDPADYIAFGDTGVIKLIAGVSFPHGPAAAQITYVGGYDVVTDPFVLTSPTADDTLLNVPTQLSMDARNIVAARYRFSVGMMTAKELDDAEERWLKATSVYRGSL